MDGYIRELNNQEKYNIGEKLAGILKLKRINKQVGNENLFYDTTWGTKTPLGLYESVKRIMSGEDN
mgnify:CR=1 FL=1